MSVPHTVEIDAADRPFTGLPDKLLDDEIILLRNGLRDAGLFEQLEAASYGGISECLGQEVAARVREVGLAKIHTVVDAADIPGVADAVYEIITKHSPGFLKTFIRETFGETRNFYFERKPNVRFHIPYDIAASQMKYYKQFARRHGDSLSLPLAGFEPGQIRALSAKVCLARLENGEFRAFSRFCPHLGSDLSLGVMRDGEVMCPWHNLPLDPSTGSSPCKSLKHLRLYSCEVKDDRVYVNTDNPS
ncbi:MAG: Rieske 2Fe-2S domain-containing protein [Gammaproteobacteria bacterium]|jgi:nitrite reductase/ring-hydroxylating ferredoxin subunit